MGGMGRNNLLARTIVPAFVLPTITPLARKEVTPQAQQLIAHEKPRQDLQQAPTKPTEPQNQQTSVQRDLATTHEAASQQIVTDTTLEIAQQTPEDKLVTIQPVPIAGSSSTAKPIPSYVTPSTSPSGSDIRSTLARSFPGLIGVNPSFNRSMINIRASIENATSPISNAPKSSNSSTPQGKGSVLEKANFFRDAANQLNSSVAKRPMGARTGTLLYTFNNYSANENS